MRPTQNTEGVRFDCSEEGETCWELSNTAYELCGSSGILGLLNALDRINRIPYELNPPHSYTLLSVLEFSVKNPRTPEDLRSHARFLLADYYGAKLPTAQPVELIAA